LLLCKEELGSAEMLISTPFIRVWKHKSPLRVRAPPQNVRSKMKRKAFHDS